MKKLLLLSIFCLSARASAPAPEMQKTKASVWGDLYLVGNMQYLGEDPQKLIIHHRLKNILDLDKHQQPIALKSSDVVVDVWVDSQESENWSCHGHPILGNSFPNALPLSMLEGKNEGDPLIFKLNCPQQKTICNVLVLCHGRNGESLKSRLDCFKERFAESPNFYCGDEKRLLAEQALIENPAYKELEKLQNKLANIPRTSIFGYSPQGMNALFEQMHRETIERDNLKRLIQQKKDEYNKTKPLTPFGNIPEYFHGPNGFKLSSAPTTQPDDTQPQAHQEQHAVESASSIAAQAHILSSAKPATKPDEMD